MDALQFPLRFDSARMKAELEHLNASRQRWHNHPDYTVVANSGDWTAIALISADKADPDDPKSLRYRGEPSGPTPILAECAYLAEVISSFKTDVHRARLMNLRPGANITPHRDYGEQRYSFERGFIRVHIPVCTNERVSFLINGNVIPMCEGEVWYTNVCNLHAVKNESTIDRVHLVLDMRVNDWVRTFFPKQSLAGKVWGAVLMSFESPTIRTRFWIRDRFRSTKEALGDMGLRKLKHRIFR